MATRCRTLLLVLSCCLAAGAETEYSRRVWRSDDGLPQNKIQAITQTADGYLWIGTSGGLVRFDGLRFVVFDRSNTPALGDDSILSLCAAHDGALWIGTEGGGLVRMKAGLFNAWGAAQGLSNGFVRSIAEAKDGGIWVGTDRGFFHVDGTRLQRLDGRGSVPVLAGFSTLTDHTGNTWVGTSRGLFRIRGGELVSDGASFQALGFVTSLIESPAGEIWLASERGLLRFADGKLQPALPNSPANPRVVRIASEGGLWVGTLGSGLAHIAGTTTISYRGNEQLPDNSVLAVFEDREQNLWVGTQDGLLRMTRSALHTLTTKDGLADDNVATVSEDAAGTLWVGTAPGQLYRRQAGRLVPFVAPGGFRARSVYVDRAGVQWFGSGSQGLLRVGRGGAARRFSTEDGMRSNNIRQFLEDRQGAMWVATGSGLTRIVGDQLKTFYLEDGLAYGGVRVLAEDANGDLLVGTDGGLNRIHEGLFVRDAEFEKLGNDRVWAIRRDTAGSLWLGTRGNGLVRLRNGAVARFATRDGLMSNSIYQILDDGARFWMSSPAGVFAVDRKELDSVAQGRPGPLAVLPYSTDSGMISSQMNGGIQPAGCRTRSGELWFPSVKGAVRIDPLPLSVTPSAPVLIESVIADDQPIPIGAGVSIAPGRGKLEIDYTAPDLHSPDHVTFRYKLEGFDETWTPSPRSRAAYYTNLPPGHYRFHVVARDIDRPGLTSEAILPITWRAHFYETVWFYALLAVAGALGILAAVRFYARQTQARYALVLAERTRLAREMHDTVIQGCVGVSTLLEAARSMPPSAQTRASELVERAATQVRLTVNEAREAVWDLRHSGIGQTEQPTDVVGTLETFARQVEASEGILVQAEITGAPAPLGNTADRNLLLIAREAIRNAVTHAHAKAISVKLRFEESRVTLEVSDDGQGFDVGSSRDNGHYGIIGMRERAEQSGGSFRLTSSPGRGTFVTASLPVRRAAVRTQKI